jgi:hypothetical protein
VVDGVRGKAEAVAGALDVNIDILVLVAVGGGRFRELCDDCLEVGDVRGIGASIGTLGSSVAVVVAAVIAAVGGTGLTAGPVAWANAVAGGPLAINGSDLNGLLNIYLDRHLDRPVNFDLREPVVLHRSDGNGSDITAILHYRDGGSRTSATAIVDNFSNLTLVDGASLGTWLNSVVNDGWVDGFSMDGLDVLLDNGLHNIHNGLDNFNRLDILNGVDHRCHNFARLDGFNLLHTLDRLHWGLARVAESDTVITLASAASSNRLDNCNRFSAGGAGNV